MRQHPPASWLDLNAAGVLIALLEIIVGISGLITPERLVQTYGFIPPLSYVWLAAYAIAGSLMLAGLWLRRTDIEVAAIVLMIGANVLQLARTAALLGAGSVTRDVMISVALIVTMRMRLRALTRGGTFIVPRWRRDGE